MDVGGCSALVRLVVAITALGLACAAPSLAQQTTPSKFDHLRTGFPLTGAHAVTPCESCHIHGQFAGTPKECGYCHRAGSGIAATVMPMRHIPTAEPCENCHRSAISWSVVHFSHVSVAPGTCFSCHNGVTAPGKPANHIATTASCDTCHTTVAWLPAAGAGLPGAFTHAGVAPGTCATCHNGTTATGKPSGHVATTASCDACHHSTTNWIPLSYLQPYDGQRIRLALSRLQD